MNGSLGEGLHLGSWVRQRCGRSLRVKSTRVRGETLYFLSKDNGAREIVK
jgi:hypothetical protein